MVKYTLFILLVAITVVGTWFSDDQNSQTSGDDTPPNIVILLADDLGYRDLNIYEGVAKTPNIDALARNGLKFTDFYSPAPNCSPARAGLLTGRNPNRVGIYSYRLPNHSMHLKGSEVTIAELLKQRNYHTAMFGKWHLSDLLPQQGAINQPTPGDQGFDHWLATENNAKPSHLNVTNFVENGEKMATLNGYSSDILVREASQWLEENKKNKNPFFLYIPFHEVHKKIASPDSLIRKYAGQKGARYKANVENMDFAIGKLIEKLRELNELQDTFILFSSDNGSYRYGSNGELRGYKGESFEGGVRVPGIIHWPQKISSGRNISAPSGLIDIVPTISEIVNVPVQKRELDGVSLLPLINNENFTRSKPLFWFFYRSHPEMGMRAGNYLLNAYTMNPEPRTHYFSDKDMNFIKNLNFKQYKLYNIEKDFSQKQNISREKPAVFDSLKTKAANILKRVIQEGPYWQHLPSFDSSNARIKDRFLRNQRLRWDCTTCER